MQVAQLYRETVRSLPYADRLQLATLILTDISAENRPDESEAWSEEDLRDFTRSTWLKSSDEKPHEA